MFFASPTAVDIAAAVQRFEQQGPPSTPEAIRAHVEPYFSPVFRARIKAIVDDELSHHAPR
jgi:hypothetical protein